MFNQFDRVKTEDVGKTSTIKVLLPNHHIVVLD